MGDTTAAGIYADYLRGYGYDIPIGISADVDNARNQGLSFDGTIRYLQDLGYNDEEITQIMTQKQGLWR